MNINFSPFPILETARLRLRQISATDVEEVYAMRSNPETMRYIPRPIAKKREDALAHIALLESCVNDNTAINWGITFEGEDKVIGIIGLLRMQPENFRTEIGYILTPAQHGKGIMAEAVKVVIDYAFEVLKFHSLEAVIDPANTASENLLKRTGFVKEAHFKENFFYDGAFLDTVIYSLLNPK